MSIKIILAAQNELIRKSSDEKDVGLTTIGMSSCTTLIMYNSEGKASLSHIDINTDLSFISDEVNFIGSNDVKFYIVRKQLIDEIYNSKILHSQKEITTSVIKYIQENFPKIENSNIIEKPIDFNNLYSDGVIFLNYELHFTTNKAINLFQMFKEEQLSRERTIDIAKYNKVPIKKIEFLLDNVDEIDFGPRDYQIRIYTHTMFTFFRPNDLRKPNIVYSNKEWTSDFTKISDDIIVTNYLNRLHKSKQNLKQEIKDIFFEITQKHLDSFAYEDSETFRYKESLPQQLNNYWNYLSKNQELSLQNDELNLHNEL